MLAKSGSLNFPGLVTALDNVQVQLASHKNAPIVVAQTQKLTNCYIMHLTHTNILKQYATASLN